MKTKQLSTSDVRLCMSSEIASDGNAESVTKLISRSHATWKQPEISDGDQAATLLFVDALADRAVS